MVAKGQQPHRVIELFVGTNEDSLRADFEAHIEGRGMSSRLREEITSYQLCALDDTWVEAVHRDVSLACKRATSYRFPWIASTLRLPQNLAMVDSTDQNSLRRMSHLFAKWRVICQPSAPKAIKAVPVRNGHRAKLLSEVYRIGLDSLQEWSVVLRDVLAPTEQLPLMQRVRRNARLKVDYLSSVISDNQIYSLPDDKEIAPASFTGALQQVTQRIEDVAASLRFFQILDCGVRKKKLVPTQATSEFKAMSFPCLVQPFAAWTGGALRESSERDVFPDGFAEVIDVLAMAEWRLLRAGLKSWKTGPSDVQGCINVGRSILVSDGPWDFRRGSVPAIVLLEKLVELGWKVGAELAEHTLTTRRVFRFADPVASKPYFQCLVSLPDLLASESFSSLPAGQPNSYYSCVLQAPRPELLKLGQPASFYAKCLAEGKGGRIVLPPGQQPAILDDEDVPISHFRNMLEDEKPRPAKVRRVAAVSSLDDAALWQELPKANQDSSEIGPTIEASGTATQTGTDISSAVPCDSGARGSSDPPCGSTKDRQPRERPMSLEGVAVNVEQHGQLGDIRSYRRLVVVCPCGEHRDGKPCVKKRNTGTRQTSAIGQLEPFAFLGAWLSARDNFATRDEHVAHAPSQAAVRAYAEARGWFC